MTDHNLNDLDMLAAEAALLDYLDPLLDNTGRAKVHDLVDWGYRRAVEKAAARRIRRLAIDCGAEDILQDDYTDGMVDAADLIDPPEA